MAADERSPEEHRKMCLILKVRAVRERRTEQAYEAASQAYAVQQHLIDRKQAELELYIQERNGQLAAMRERFRTRAGGADYERMLMFEEQTKMRLSELSQEVEQEAKTLNRLADGVRQTYADWTPARSKRMKSENIVEVKRKEAAEYLDMCEDEAAGEMWRPRR